MLTLHRRSALIVQDLGNAWLASELIYYKRVRKEGDLAIDSDKLFVTIHSMKGALRTPPLMEDSVDFFTKSLIFWRNPSCSKIA